MRLVILRIAASAAALLPLLPAIAHAELGGAGSTVKTDGVRLNARLASVARSGFIRHDLTRTNGGMVHELTNAKGQVFAVTWSGPGKPDLRTLLGPYFNTLQTPAGGMRRNARALRRPPQVSQPDLQIVTSGHMGFFRGVAFIPSLAPAGFSTGELGQDQ